MKPAVGFTLPWAGVISFGFAQDRLCTRCSYESPLSPESAALLTPWRRWYLAHVKWARAHFFVGVAKRVS